MIFTKEQIKELEKRLYMNRVKDSQFPNATDLDGSEFFVIVQDGKNKKISLSDMWNFLLKKAVEDVVKDNNKNIDDILDTITYFGNEDSDNDPKNPK